MDFPPIAAVASDSTTLALIGVISTVIISLFKLLNDNTRALTMLVLSSEKVALATTKGADEAKQRNGHLGEQNLKLAKLVTMQNKDVGSIRTATSKTAEILSKSALIAAEDRDILTGGSQTIHEQTVEHQIVKNKG